VRSPCVSPSIKPQYISYQCPSTPSSHYPFYAMSPHSKNKSKPSKKPTKKVSLKQTYASIQKTAMNAKKKHGKAESTTNSYDGHVCRGMEWLAMFAQEEQEHVEERWQAEEGENLSIDEDNEDNEDITEIGQAKEEGEELDITMDPKFPTAFTGPPVKCTPIAIAMFMAYKCFTEDLGVSTANAIHAAFIRHYDTM